MDSNFLNIYRQNLDTLRKYLPGMVENIEQTDISNFRIDVSDQGINFFIGDHPLYPLNVNQYLATQIEQFIYSPTALLSSPRDIELDPVAPVQNIYINKMLENLPRLQQDNTKFHTHLDSLPVLLLFGAGTFVHIEQLIQLVDIKTLIIVEDSFHMIKASMHIINWQPIFEYFSRDGYSIEFYVDKNEQAVAKHIINTLYGSYLFYYNFIPFFLTYKSGFLVNVYNHIRANYNKLTHGWGFYDDEILGLKHTLKNLKNPIHILTNTKKLPESSCVFVIASGPSIDKDIETIKQYKGKAVIFSCGTALRILVQNGIIPDYQIESERTYSKYIGLSQMGVDKKYFEQITFIGLNVIHPDVFTLFKKVKIFFRSNDCGSSVIPEDIPQLNHCNPTATNAGLSLAVEMGFDNIYLFGCDVGYKDEKYHHSKDSAYYDKNCPKHYNMRQFNTTHVLKSNFDNQQILSSEVLIWCKQSMENCIIDNANKKQKTPHIYNCSDGAYIEYTKPLKSDLISLGSAIPKNLVLLSVEEKFSYDGWNLNYHFSKEIKETIKIIDKIIFMIKEETQIVSFSHFFNLANKIYKLIYTNKERTESSMIFSLTKGTFIEFFNILYVYSSLSQELQNGIDFINTGFGIIIEFLEKVKEEVSALEY